jgi:hypothetical protein
MKTLLLIAAALILGCFSVYSAPPGGGKASPGARAKPDLRFASYDGDPRPNQKAIIFQIINHDHHRQSSLIMLGERVPRTKFDLTKFEFKTRPTPAGNDEDISELTLTHAETKEAMVLVLASKRPVRAAP